MHIASTITLSVTQQSTAVFKYSTTVMPGYFAKTSKQIWKTSQK